MRFLHTADWHVGKTVRGRSRAGEHVAVFAEIARIADDESVDFVIVAGDVFDTAGPAPESERIVYRALLDLSAGGDRPVIVLSGNHDNPRRLGAVSPVFDLANVHVQTAIRRPDDGGVRSLTIARTGETARLALVPFLSQRHVVHAADLMALDATQTGGQYADRCAQLIAALTAGFTPDAVNIVVAHLMVSGGVLGGGERSAHTIFDYWVAANAFPATAHYVALGHLHRQQRIEGPCPIWYSGSPLAMDFGEETDRKAVLVVDAEPGVPSSVRSVPLMAGRGFRTVRGTFAELTELAATDPDLVSMASADVDVEMGVGVDTTDAHDHLRVIVHEKVRVGLADEVRALFPTAVDIRVEAPASGSGRDQPGPEGSDGSPHELFVRYLAARGVDDRPVVALFDELLERVTDESRDAPAEASNAT